MYPVSSSVTIAFLISVLHAVLGDTPDSFRRPLVLEECSAGEQGPPGPPGPPGPAGIEAFPISVSKNWRQCSWLRTNDGQDNGQVYSCDFTKEYDDTSIYVSMSTNMRVAYTNGACCRWYMKFNGNECSDPDKIEAVTYAAGYGVSYNLHRPRVLVGYCDGIAAGSVAVTFWVGTCNGYGTYDCYTGWNSASHLIVEEVTPSPY
ncbi:collagen triple helix repeat-containing protein 1-like [Amphiura filiformis]|uniref:collagen triple helix repeat-containing protein 1-like n=1 Tax=Amphiura filiformis TaxID=82378 RepID=UPI003B21971C